MIERFNSFTINEKLSIKNDNIINISILFTDIVKSSELWRDHKNGMMEALEDQSVVFDRISKKYNGTIIKTIGDAYMIAFKTIEESIKCAIELQKKLNDNPIKINNKKIEIRSGICYGPVYETYIDIQGNKLIDYLGNTVNTASRVESKVCKPGNVVFSSIIKDIDNDGIEKITEDYDVDMVSFNNTGDEIKSSSRLLTDVQRHTYKNIDELKGINKIDVYQIKIK